jgi:transposase
MSCEIQRLGVSWVSKLKSNWKISAEVSKSSYPVKQLTFWKNYWVVSNFKVKYFFMNTLKPNKVFRIWHPSLDVCYATQSQTNNGLIWLASNHLFKHKTMVKLYRLRWKIEVFFKDLKQNLKLSSSHFVDFSKNRFHMELRILVLTILQLLKNNYRKYKNKTTGELMNQLKIELSQITNNHYNPLIYIQLHLINKTQNPFEALCDRALRH